MPKRKRKVRTYRPPTWEDSNKQIHVKPVSLVEVAHVETILRPRRPHTASGAIAEFVATRRRAAIAHLPSLVAALAPIDALSLMMTSTKAPSRSPRPPASRPSGPRPSAKDSSYRTLIDAFIQRQKQETSDRVRVNIGLDVGTSFTKVVWRDSLRERSRALKVNSKRKGIDAFLLPSRVWTDGTSLFWGDGDDETSGRVEHFKMCLSCVGEGGECGPARCPLTDWSPFLSLPCPSESPVELVSAFFLANLISTARRLITEELRSQGIKKEIHWSANLAVPVKQMDNTKVVETFERSLSTAWLMSSVLDEHPTLCEVGEITRCFEEATAAAKNESLDCFVYPEVGAQVASATLSQSARDGLYSFVDVGAGTIDVSVFRLAADRGDASQQVYDAEVLKLGAAHLEAAAAQGLMRISKQTFRDLKEGKITPKQAELALTKLSATCYPDALALLRDIAVDLLVPVLRDAFEKEKFRSAWKQMYLILGGGGAKLQVYRDASEDVFKRLAERFEMRPLSAPADFDSNGFPNAEFHRLAVAYGLSFEIVNLPEVVLPRDVVPLKPIEGVSSRREMITKDLV